MFHPATGKLTKEVLVEEHRHGIFTAAKKDFGFALLRFETEDFFDRKENLAVCSISCQSAAAYRKKSP